MPMAASWPGELGVELVGRLVLHVRVEHLEEAEVARRDGVDDEAAALDETWSPAARSTGAEPDLAGQDLGDAGAVAARDVGIDLQRSP